MYSLNGIPFTKTFVFERTAGQTDTRTNERTDGRSDYIMPQILFGGIKTRKKKIYNTIYVPKGIVNCCMDVRPVDNVDNETTAIRPRYYTPSERMYDVRHYSAVTA